MDGVGTGKGKWAGVEPFINMLLLGAGLIKKAPDNRSLL